MEATQDFGNLVALEHVNLNIKDQAIATEFYARGLGLTRDPYLRTSGFGTMWINVGSQQIHLPVADKAQTINGAIHLQVPGISALIESLEKSRSNIPEVSFTVESEGHLKVVGPYGNTFYIQEPPKVHFLTRNYPIALTGISVYVRIGQGAKIVKFYETIIGARCWQKEENVYAVRAGPGQAILFEEMPDDMVPGYDGWHIAIYIADFSLTFQRAAAKSLVWMNPRFIDKASTLEGALEERQFRIRDIVDVESGEVLIEMEHEVRSLAHPAFMRPLVNKNLPPM